MLFIKEKWTCPMSITQVALSVHLILGDAVQGKDFLLASHLEVVYHVFKGFCEFKQLFCILVHR